MSGLVVVQKTSLAEKQAMVTEAKRRFHAVIADLDSRHAVADLAEKCELLKKRIDLIQAYGDAITNIFQL